MLKEIYLKPMGLLVDLYQITMACGYWKSGRSDDEAVFNLFYRTTPFNSNFALCCGLEYIVDYLKNFQFEDDDIEYLASLACANGAPLFERGFLDYLKTMSICFDIDAVEEGRLVFPYEPILRVKGKLIQCQLFETALLNMINFQTLIATKSVRVCLAARGEPVLEFGLRRAPGIDGALSASRAAYIGGCAATSNVMAGKLFDIPVRGTHAHSWVMSFASEEESFEAYAEAMPNNCVFLVDTYDTIEGVKRAIEVGKKLHAKGYSMSGIRLDSGNLTDLSIRARKLLDNAGFEKALIFASNDLDEFAVSELKEKGAVINIWGIGTRLVTGYDHPSLGGVYKLAAVRKAKGKWEYCLKLSEERIKISTPGIQQVRRFFKNNVMVADGIYDINQECNKNMTIIAIDDPLKKFKASEGEYETEDMLKPIFRHGKCVYDCPSIHDIRKRTLNEMKILDQETLKLKHSDSYFVGLEENLNHLKEQLVKKKQT